MRTRKQWYALAAVTALAAMGIAAPGFADDGDLTGGTDAGGVEVIVPTDGPADPGVTDPPADPGVTDPPTDPKVTDPPADPGVTEPPADPGATDPLVEGAELRAPMALAAPMANAAPDFTSPATLPTGYTGLPYTFTFTTSGNPAPEFTLGVFGVPSWASLSDDGVLTGTPTHTGTYHFRVYATNWYGSPISLPHIRYQDVTLTIQAGVAPTVSVPDTVLTLRTDCSLQVVGTGTPAPTYTFTGLPSFATGHSDGTVTIQCAAWRTGGEYPNVTVTASNGIAPDATATFTLTVQEEAWFDGYYFYADENGVIEDVTPLGQPYTLDLVLWGFPAPTVSITSGALPDGMTVGQDGVITGTPTESGEFSAVIHAANGVLSPLGDDTVTLNLTVTEQPTVTGPTSIVARVGEAVSETYDLTGYPAPEVELNWAPSWLTITDNGDGTATVSGTPTAADVASTWMMIIANNYLDEEPVGWGGLDVLVQVYDPPTIAASGLMFTIGQAHSVAVTAGGNPTPTLSVLGTLPAGLTFVDNGDGTGSIAGTPAAGTAGRYPLTLVATTVLPEVEPEIQMPTAFEAFAAEPAQDVVIGDGMVSTSIEVTLVVQDVTPAPTTPAATPSPDEGGLAATGAPVLGLGVLALLMVGAGGALRRRAIAR